MDRRKFLALTGTGVAAGLAGCLPDVEQVEELPRPVLGDEESDVVLRVFEDLGCPACQTYNQTVQPPLLEEYVETGDIRYEYYDYVLPANPSWSNYLNNAVRGVQDRQGNQAFWDFKDAMYDNQDQIDIDIVRDEAEAVGVEDPDELANDADAGVYDPVIESDMDFGESEYSVSATPTLVLNGQVLSGAAGNDFDVLSGAIETELND